MSNRYIESWLLTLSLSVSVFALLCTHTCWIWFDCCRFLCPCSQYNSEFIERKCLMVLQFCSLSFPWRYINWPHCRCPHTHIQELELSLPLVTSYVCDRPSYTSAFDLSECYGHHYCCCLILSSDNMLYVHLVNKGPRQVKTDLCFMCLNWGALMWSWMSPVMEAFASAMHIQL